MAEGDGQEELIRISPEEVAAAVVPPPRPVCPAPVAPRGREPGISQLAVASLVLAVIGIPLVGCLLGPIAIVCGVLALTAGERNGERRGFGVALAGTILGIVDAVAWGAAIWMLAARPVPSTVLHSPMPQFQAPLDVSAAPGPIREALRANVRVTCERGPRVQGSGSGVVVRVAPSQSLVLTNRHVVECGEKFGDSARLRVAASEGAEHPAKILWTAADGVDLAIVAVDQKLEATSMPLRRSSGARIGDKVFAIGNPLGFDATYTVGTLSAVRSMNQGGGRSLRVYQVQASVNPGNSGGGLYDEAGGLIGINTWTAEKSLAEGLGFSIAVEEVVAALEASGEVWASELTAGAQPSAEKGLQ